MKPNVSEKQINAILYAHQFQNSEQEITRLPLEQERNLLNKIRTGKYRDISVAPFEELNIHMGISTESSFKHFEYMVVSCIALSTRAAIDGGMRVDRAFDISDAMLRRLELAQNIEELHAIFELTAIVFAKGVMDSQRERNSYVIQQCKSYVAKHIYDSLYVRQIAEHLGMNSDYLSHLFAQKEGLPLHDYIQKEKVRAASWFLKHSGESVGMIAQYMGYRSQSTFSKVFKKWTDLTPLEYRSMRGG